MTTVKGSIQAINNRLINLWENNTVTSLVPMFYPEPVLRSILFIGINPSFNAKAIMRDLKNEPKAFSSVEEIEAFYKNDRNTIERKVSRLQAIQSSHRKHLTYFEKHRQLAKRLKNHPWEQIDLFQIRESIQIKLLNRLNLSDPFFAAQIDIFFELINIIEPKAIIVLNKASSDFLKKYFFQRDPLFSPLNSESDQYQLNLNEKMIPVMFSIHTQYKKIHERLEIEQRIIEFVNGIKY